MVLRCRANNSLIRLPSSSSCQRRYAPSVASAAPKSCLVISNPHSSGEVNVKNVFASVVKPAFDDWGTYYGDGEVLIDQPGNEEAFRDEVGMWMENFSLGRLGLRAQKTGTGSVDKTENKNELPELITILGGDSTVNSVVSMLHALDDVASTSPASSSPMDTPLLLLPSGMCNSIAASVGIPVKINSEGFRNRLGGAGRTRRVQTYEVVLKPTKIVAARMRADLLRSMSTESLPGDGGTSVCIGHCLGGMSVGLWPNIIVKANMLANLTDGYPGAPSFGHTSLSLAALREVARASPVLASLTVTRGGKSRAIEGPYKMINVSALPCQALGWALTPSAASNVGLEARNKWQSAGHKGTSTGQLVATTADTSATRLRLLHLLFREARRNSPSSTAMPSNYSDGVDPDKLLREDGVEVYGGGRGAHSDDATNPDNNDGGFHSTPFETVSIRNDSPHLPMMAMVDGAPYKLPPLCELEMRATGKSVTLLV